MPFLTSVFRSCFVVAIIILARLDYAIRGLGHPKSARSNKALWLHQWSRRLAPFIGLRVTIQGNPPTSGMVVCNHLGYLDIITLSSISPCLFVAKKEIRDWPVFGPLARNGGTIFIDREKVAALKPTLEEVESALREGTPVVLFPEGTSSGGTSVLPFRSPLLQAAISTQSPITASAIDYQIPQGSVADEICYWRDMTLLPHLWNLLSKQQIQALVRFASSQPPTHDRKSLAPLLRSEVLQLRGLGGS